MKVTLEDIDNELFIKVEPLPERPEDLIVMLLEGVSSVLVDASKDKISDEVFVEMAEVVAQSYKGKLEYYNSLKQARAYELNEGLNNEKLVEKL